MAECFEALTSGVDRVVLPSAAYVIKQASPTTAFVNPGTLTAFSNNSGSFDSTTLGTRTILYFSTPLPAAKNHQLYIGPSGSNSSGVGAVSFAYLYAVAPSTHDFQSSIRVRPIVAAYDFTNVTWNTFNATLPTFGTSVFAITRVQGLVTPATTATLTYGTPSFVAFDSTKNIFGFVIDGMPLTAAGGTLTSISVSLTVAPSFAFVLKGS